MISIWKTPAAALAALACGFGLAGCATGPAGAARELVTDDPQLVGTAAKDKVLWQDRLAVRALRAGRFDEAKARLDDAILTMGGIIANSADAARARSLWSAESEKVFIGEPYERAMTYYYRGILYWRDGEPDNARACFRSAQFIDSAAGDAAYQSDYVLLDYLDGLASTKLAADGSDALARAEKNAQHALPPYDAGANVLVFAEWGRGPLKYAGGRNGEQLRFETRESRARRAVLTVEGRTIPLPAYDDLNFQATTRGGRVMDHILGNKAVFKDSADTIGDVALAGAVIAAEQIRKRNGEKSRDAENTAIALGIIGLISKGASAAANATADTRTWDNLPQTLSFAALRLPPGDHAATLEFLDDAGQPLPARTQEVVLHVESADRDTVVFLSELAKKQP
ncbi:MAG: hypothetical protein HY302_13970 [Opitutae bacterium]|nr:hypothetical protein [Opitutae bacterium]